MQRLVIFALLGLCLHLKGCGNSGDQNLNTKCRCDRRLESVLPKADDTPGRMLSSRRRRTISTNAEYSEFCCDDPDPGSTWTVAPYDPYSETTEWNWRDLDIFLSAPLLRAPLLRAPLLRAPQRLQGLPVPLPLPPLGGSSLRDLFTHFRSLVELRPK